MTNSMRLLFVAMMATVVVGGSTVVWASGQGTTGPASTGQRAALEVSVVVSPSCAVHTSEESDAKPLSLHCSRSGMPAGFTPRTEIISAGPSTAGPSADGPSNPSASTGQSKILSILF